MQTQPIFDQLNNDFVRHQVSALSNFGRFNPQRRAKIFFAPQDRAWRRHRDAELARNHFRLRPLSRPGRAQKNESSFH